MNQLVNEAVIKLAETIQLPERVFHIDDLPWVPFDDGDEEVITLFILGGSLQYFDENNRVIGQDDVYTVLKKYKDYCNEKGIEIVDDLIY
ncbi:hypothetical protein [Paenibacillus sp. An7]|uniref:hypothetical protein n=1 Tax=Paenibacillus sp. An7 TaxID=2689577 RepID=UPI00135A2B4E|nr:hypothetical protein [Paenibacillus sp. An7]